MRIDQIRENAVVIYELDRSLAEEAVSGASQIELMTGRHENLAAEAILIQSIKISRMVVRS